MTETEILYVGSKPLGDHERGLLLAHLIWTDDRLCGMASTTVTAITARDVQNLCAAVYHLQACLDKTRVTTPEPGPNVEYEE